MNDKPIVEIYTDGACSGNPGKGGYGVVLRYKTSEGKYITKELSGGFSNTTNNRMEILAAIIAFEVLKKPCSITICSDSKYLIDAVKKKWLSSWIARGWKTAGKKPVKNIDLWKRLVAAMEPHDIDWVWVKGHNGHEFNERCDKLAVNAYNSGNLDIDTGFKNQSDG
ncbi:MAG: ribonuclease HI [Candidatus Gastranaerophilales bacterium]|nr:ribonuclease HI [Candidatus Gastranaerophilales bacterium]